MRYELEAAVAADPTFRSNVPDSVDAEWISATIGMIYDCVVAPERWAATIESITRHLSFSTAAIGLIGMREGSHRGIVHRGLDAEWLGLWDPYVEELFNLWGGRDRFAAYPFDEVIVASEVISSAAAMENRYLSEILAPRGLRDGIFVTLARDGDLLGYFCMNRPGAAGPMLPWERDSLRLLTPHLRRAVTISNLFDVADIEKQTFRSVLEAMRHAVILVDEAANIVHSNDAGASMLADNSEIGTLNGRLTLTFQPAQDALEAALLIAARDEAQLAQRGMGIPLRSGDGSPLLLHVLPLRRGQVRSGVMQRAVAAIFIAASTRSSDPPVDAASLLYDLTPAEARVFSIISKGRTVADAAQAMGIAKSTAKTHLHRLFGKTGCSRQAQLVALAAQLSSPV